MIKFLGICLLLFAAPLPEIVEIQIPGHVTIWRDELAPGFLPSKANVQSYLQELTWARTNNGALNGSLQFRVLNYSLSRYKGRVALKLRGTYTQRNQRVHFAELQVFTPKKYHQYTFTGESGQRFDEAQAFYHLYQVADRDP